MNIFYSCKLIVCDLLKCRLKMARWCFYCCHGERDPLGPHTWVIASYPGDWVTGSKYEASSAFTFSEGKRLSSGISRGFSDHLVKQFVKEEHGKILKHEFHMSYYNSYCQESADTCTTSLASLLFSQSVISNSLCPHGLKPTRLLCPLDFPSKNTGVDCHFFLQGLFLTQGSNLHLLHWQMTSESSGPLLP